MKHIKTFESFLNEAQKGRTVRDNNLIYFQKMSDAEHTRLVRWMGQNLDAPDYKFTKGGRTSIETHTLDVSTLSDQDLKDLIKYMDSQKYQFSTTIWLPAFEGVNEGHLPFDIEKKLHLGGVSFEFDEERTEEDDDSRFDFVQVYYADERRNGNEWVIKVGTTSKGTYILEIIEDEKVVFTQEYPRGQKAHFDQDCANSLGFVPELD